MKILFVCTEKLPLPCIKGGAIQIYIDGILPYIRQQHEVVIFCIAHPDLSNHELVDGVRYERIEATTAETYYQEVAMRVAKEMFDWIIIYNRPKYLPWIAVSAPSSRFLLSMHNEMFHSEKISAEVARSCLERVERVITVSQFIADGIAYLFPEYQHKLQVVYAGVNLEQFPSRWVPEIAERRLELLAANGLEDRLIALSVGRLSDKKGPHVLISAMPQLLSKHPSTVLLLVGSKWYGTNEENSYVQALKQQAQSLGDSVRFTGFIPPSEMPQYFLLGDLFICASQWQEPLARVHYEAMATGLPIITTMRGGNSEVILPEKNGLLVTDYQKPAAFADKIDYLLTNPNQAEQMGRAGRYLAEKRFYWYRVASNILQLLEA